MVAKKKVIHKQVRIKYPLYNFLHDFWNENKGRYSAKQNKIIEHAFKYIQFDNQLTDFFDSPYVRGEEITLSIDTRATEEIKDTLAEGASLLKDLFKAVQEQGTQTYEFTTKKTYEKRLPVSEIERFPRLLTNSLQAKNEAEGLNIDSFGKFELITLIYLFDNFMKDASKQYALHFDTDSAIVLNYSHIIKTTKLTGNRNAKTLIKKAIDTLNNTKVNISVNDKEYRAINIIETKRNKITNEVTGIYLHPDARVLKKEFQKYVQTGGVNVYDIIQETNSSSLLIHLFKFIEISIKNKEFNGTIESTAKMLKINIETKQKKHKFKNELKEIFTILKKYNYITVSEMTTKNIHLEFSNSKKIDK